MDTAAATPSAPRTLRPEPRRATSNGKVARVGDRPDEAPASKAQARPMSYKEKFQTLREKYEHVTSDHTRFERELAIADEKVKRLQEECNLLLDAVDIAVPAQPSLLYYLSQDPIPQSYHSYTVPPAPTFQQAAPPPPPITTPAPPPSTHAHHHRRTSSQTNGNSNGVKRR